MSYGIAGARILLFNMNLSLINNYKLRDLGEIKRIKEYSVNVSMKHLQRKWSWI
jgi:hypothetical protein